MALATLERLTEQVRDDLAGYYGNRRSAMETALGHLLNMLITAETPAKLDELSGEVHGLSTHLRRLESHLQNNSRLPEAVCARYKYKLPTSRALARYKVSKSAWTYFHELAEDVNFNPELNVPLITYEDCPWHDELQEHFVALEVMLDSAALEAMLICALEAYLSPRRPRRKGYEVYGINLGMMREIRHRKFRDDVCITRYVSVMHSQPQLSAESEYGFVEPNRRSLDAILQATQALHPHYQAVGDFHSHPYDDLSTLEYDRGWQYTPSDEDSNVGVAKVMADLGHHIQVSFVIGIARSNQRVARRHYRGLKNTIQMTLGNCRVILAAYRVLGSGRLTNSNIRLRISGVAG